MVTNSGTSTNRLHWFLLLSGAAVLVWSGIRPRDQLTWLLEIIPILAGAAVLLLTFRRFPLSRVAYVMIWIHAIILLIGSHWTYEHMPLFSWLRDAFDLDRNYYDRVGHVAQGFFPAIVAREILLRTSPLRRGKWLFWLVLSLCLALSAAYELLEWAAALALGESADQFLAMQGDPWDTQWDMFLAACGAVVSLLTLSRMHDRSIFKLRLPTPA